MPSKDSFDLASEKTAIWIATLQDFPGFARWKAQSVAATMSHDDERWNDVASPANHFVFPPHIEKQHDAIVSFYGLHSTWQAMADTEFYFRRYPFSDLPVSMDTHLRYTCEAYFSRVYEFSERLKKCLPALNKVAARQINVGALVKEFGRDFRDEIKARNLVHHHYRFDDVVLDRIMIEGMMAMTPGAGGDRGWKSEQRRTYRKASLEWASRARKRSARVRVYLNAVADFVIQDCLFLADPLTIDLH